MKTTRLLAAMLLAAGLLQLPVAHAVSAAVAKPLKEASDLVRAGKAKEALAKLNGVTGSGPDDTYMLARIRGAAYQSMGDNGAAAQQLEAAFGTGKVPGERGRHAGRDHRRHLRPAAQQRQGDAVGREGQGRGRQQLGPAPDPGLRARLQRRLRPDRARQRREDRRPPNPPAAVRTRTTCCAWPTPTATPATRPATCRSRKSWSPTTRPTSSTWASTCPTCRASRASRRASRWTCCACAWPRATLTTAADYMEMAQLLLQAQLPAEAKVGASTRATPPACSAPAPRPRASNACAT